jgi:hypothetical protein
LRTYARERQIKREAEAKARAADKILKPIKENLLAELDGVTSAICGTMLVSVKHTAPALATVTLPSGEKVLWTSVHSIVVGNHVFPASECKLYGGREGGAEIEMQLVAA